MTHKGFTVPQRLALAIVPPLAAFVIAAIGITLRFRVIAEEGFTPPTPPAPGIFCFWHRCTLPCAWYFRKARAVILISQSFDGELIARTLRFLGYRSVRGSSTRGGATGLLTLQGSLQNRETVVFTADGPRGPIYTTKIGPVKLAQMAAEPIHSFYLLPEHAWVLNSWDRFLIPRPFSCVAVSWGLPVAAPPQDADATALEAVRLQLNDAMERARLRAEAYFGR